MIVQWTEFDALGFSVAKENYPDNADPKDFDTLFEGKVLDKYHTFWGTPKFVVALADGEIRTVPMEKCRIVTMKGNKDHEV